MALADCGGGLRGVQTTKATKAGAELLRVPRELILDDARADASPVGKLWADAAAPVPAYLRIALLLLHELRLGDASPLAQYVAMLPTAAEFAAEGGPAALWTDDELALLDAQARRRCAVAPPSARGAPGGAPPRSRQVERLGLPGASPTADELAWAVAAVTSRAYGADEGGRSISMLIPMVDMATRPPAERPRVSTTTATRSSWSPRSWPGDGAPLVRPAAQPVLLLQFGFVPGSDTDFALVDCGRCSKCGAAADGAAAPRRPTRLLCARRTARCRRGSRAARARAAVEALAAAGCLGDEDGRAAYLDLVKRTLLAFGTSADDARGSSRRAARRWRRGRASPCLPPRAEAALRRV